MTGMNRSKLATPAGLEPATCRLEVGRSIQLSYGAIGLLFNRFARLGETAPLLSAARVNASRTEFDHIENCRNKTES